jgi:hypothetical protein
VMIAHPRWAQSRWMPTKVSPLSDEALVEMLSLMRGADSVELKLTIPEAGQRSALEALRMDPLGAQVRLVSFFDTPELALERQGVVVRARRVASRGDDSVVKLRPIVPTELPRAADRRADLVAGVPAHVLQLAVAGHRIARRVASVEAEHQRDRERPRLGLQVADVANGDAGLLQHLARDRVLQPLARLDEPGQRAVTARRPRRLAAHQAAVAVGDEHDHHRIGARMMLVAVGADADVTALPRDRRGPADPAEARRARPVGQRRRVGDNAQLRGGQRHGEVAQTGERHARALDREERAVGPDAEEDPLNIVGSQRQRLRVDALPSDDDRARRGVTTGGVQPGGVRAARPGAIQRAAGEGDGIR